jgi:hypothetical protein
VQKGRAGLGEKTVEVDLHGTSGGAKFSQFFTKAGVVWKMIYSSAGFCGHVLQ